MLKFHRLRVAAVRPEAEEAVAVDLEVPSALEREYRGVPGQHIVLRAEVAGEELRRTYSLVSSPGEYPLRIVARAHPGGRMSEHLAGKLRAGEDLEVLPPNGSFTPHASGSGGLRVAFASGCGITPIVSIARAVLSDPANRMVIFYGNRSGARAMCLEELEAIKDRHLDRLSLHFLMSGEPQEVELYNGRIDAGKVRALGGVFFEPGSVLEYFVCGPGNMIETVSSTLGALGVPPERIRAEHFTVSGASAAPAAVGAQRSEPAAAGAARERASAPAPAGASGPTPSAEVAEVTVLMDGRRRSFSMRMNDESILDGAARAGIELPFSCRAGVCSTCRTKVVRGEVRMAQNYALEDWELEQGYVLACQSQVKTPVLELDYDEK